MKAKTTQWLRYLPASLRIRIEGNPGLRKALINTSWLFADQALRLIVGLFVSVWVARYLGPDKFGLLNYAMAFVALFATVASLGLSSIVVRDLVNEPETANVTLGTAFFLQLIGGLLAFASLVVAVNIIHPDDALVRLIVIVLGAVMVFKSTEVVKYWFESQVHSKHTVWVENAAFLLFACVKVTLVLRNASLMAFVWALFTEAVLVAVALLALYAWRGGRLFGWKIQYQRIKSLLKDSWSLILTGLAVMVYMRIDQIMLGQMLGDQAVGIYSAAVRISELPYFIPVAIVASVFPSIIESKKESEYLYSKRLQGLYDLMVLLALFVAVTVTFLSNWAVNVLFGPVYQLAGVVLAIHAWAGVFVFLGVASSRWFLVENLQRYLFYRAVAGAFVNIGLNLVLIPKYGIRGAAIATVLSQALASVFFNVCGKKMRPVLVMQLRSLTGFGLFLRIKSIGKGNK